MFFTVQKNQCQYLITYISFKGLKHLLAQPSCYFIFVYQQNLQRRSKDA